MDPRFPATGKKQDIPMGNTPHGLHHFPESENFMANKTIPEILTWEFHVVIPFKKPSGKISPQIFALFSRKKTLLQLGVS